MKTIKHLLICNNNVTITVHEYMMPAFDVTDVAKIWCAINTA